MTPRRARPSDAAMIAKVHVKSWQEAYAGLLPKSEIAARSVAERAGQWSKVLQAVDHRVWVIPDFGFAMFGPQREEVWRAGGYPDELYAIYLLRAGYGMGRSLMRASCAGSGPFTACVIAGNSRACAFYEKSGGQHLLTRQERIGQSPIAERVYRWDAPPFGV